MKAQALKCPNCNAALEIEDGIDTFFCKYCGYKIILEDLSEASINAKVQVKKMEHQERMRDKQYEQERYKYDKQYEQERYKFDKKEQRKRNEARKKTLGGVAIAVACVLYFAFMASYFNSAKQESIEEEKQLQALVDEVMIDIENGDYDEAYVKANSIRCTSAWSDEIEDKWDATREALLEQIEQAEKESSGDSGGFFDWFK